MLDPRSWLPQAKELAEGKSARGGHDCGPGSVLVVSHKSDGWSAWCFRCAEKGWVPKPLPTLAERVARKQAQLLADEEMERDPRPPYPPVFDVQQWPLQARVWLYKAGLFNEDIERLGAYYHERSRRVILPVVKDGELVYWQGRNVGLCELDAPKYINPRVDRSQLVAEFGTGPDIVLTEDILSAYRVGMATEAWSLLGTKLPTPILVRLLEAKRHVFVWLDDDAHGNNPGQHAAAIILRTLTNVGIPCSNIRTTKDPKLLSRAEIQEVLSVARHNAAAGNEAPQGIQEADPNGERPSS